MLSNWKCFSNIYLGMASLGFSFLTFFQWCNFFCIFQIDQLVRGRNNCIVDIETENSLVDYSVVTEDIIKWKHFPHYWTFVRGIHRWPVNSPHKGQWHGALMFSLICVWINGWANNCESGDLRCHRTHHDVIVMSNYNVVQWLPSCFSKYTWYTRECLV